MTGATEPMAAALPLDALGWRLLPCERGGKRPLLRDWPAKASADLAVIEGWARRWPGCNVGLATGAGSGVLALDVDRHGEVDGEATLAALLDRHGALPRTATQRTGGGGRQLLFAWPAGRRIGNTAGKLGPGLDTRGEGGFVVLAPSLHPSGQRYAWLLPPWEVPPASAPAWLLDLLDPPPPPRRAPLPVPDLGDAYGEAALRRAVERVGSAPEGERNRTLNAEAFGLGQLAGAGLLSAEIAAVALASAALAAGLGRHETERTIASGLRAGLANPRAGR